MRNNEDDEMIQEFVKNLDKSQLAKQIQSYIKDGKSGMFQERKTEKEYKEDIINLLKERKRNGL